MNFATSFGLSLLGLPLPVSGCLPVGPTGCGGTRRVPPQSSCLGIGQSIGTVRDKPMKLTRKDALVAITTNVILLIGIHTTEAGEDLPLLASAEIVRTLS